MLSSFMFEKLKKPAILQVSRIINRTSQRIDTDLLTKRITITLNNSQACKVNKYSTSRRKNASWAENPLPTPTTLSENNRDRESVGRGGDAFSDVLNVMDSSLGQNEESRANRYSLSV
ncbi:MAG: hypothetical protein ACLUKN_05565 [Bacilli bacterium]